MLLPVQCQTGILLRRYKRFLADVLLADQSVRTVHCPNSGAMLGCSSPGSAVLISYADNPSRKYAWTLEMVQEQGVWIGVHTGRTNAMVREALESGLIRDFGKICYIRPEVKSSAKSRLDFLLETDQGKVWLEVKSCSLAKNGVALFPDAVTKRGVKHLQELAQLAAGGVGAAVLFCVQRGDAHCCSVAKTIDPLYAQTLIWAQQQGVRFLAYQAEICPQQITLTRALPFVLP